MMVYLRIVCEIQLSVRFKFGKALRLTASCFAEFISHLELYFTHNTQNHHWTLTQAVTGTYRHVYREVTEQMIAASQLDCKITRIYVGLISIRCSNKTHIDWLISVNVFLFFLLNVSFNEKYEQSVVRVYHQWIRKPRLSWSPSLINKRAPDHGM